MLGFKHIAEGYTKLRGQREQCGPMQIEANVQGTGTSVSIFVSIRVPKGEGDRAYEDLQEASITLTPEELRRLTAELFTLLAEMESIGRDREDTAK
jgi:hypothetical protein